LQSLQIGEAIPSVSIIIHVRSKILINMEIYYKIAMRIFVGLDDVRV
jgi:hypothetical protein